MAQDRLYSTQILSKTKDELFHKLRQYSTYYQSITPQLLDGLCAMFTDVISLPLHSVPIEDEIIGNALFDVCF